MRVLMLGQRFSGTPKMLGLNLISHGKCDNVFASEWGSAR